MPIVRLYPTGEVSPQPIPNVAPNVPAAGDINLLGGNQARDLQQAGQNLGQASDSLFALYQRSAQEANESRVQDFTNRFLDGRRAILQGYENQTGADAIAGADAAIGKLTTLRDELLGQTANGYQREKLAPILDAHLAASSAGITRHAVAQQEVYSRGVAASAIETSRAEAIADPAMMDNAVMRAEGAARALHAGQSPEAVETGVRAAGGSVIAGVIGDRLSRNDPMGVALYRQYADRLDPHDRSTLDAAAETLSNSIEAIAWLRNCSATLPLEAVNAASEPIAEPPPVVSSSGTLLDQDGVAGTRERLDAIEQRRRALIALNEQEFTGNPTRLRANQTAIETVSAQGRAAVKAEADGLYADLRRYLTTGGPGGQRAIALPPATLISRFSDEQKASIARQVDRAIEGRLPATDPQTWYAIQQGLTGGDTTEQQRWASANLVPFMERLSGEDYVALAKLQTAVRSNEGGAESTRLQLITRMANQALREQGIDPTPRSDSSPDSDAAQAATFHRALQNELSAFESRGRQATESEAYDSVNGLMSTAINGGWIRPRNRQASVTLAPDVPSTDNAFDKRNMVLAQAGPEDVKPRATSGYGEIQQASLADGPSETQKERETRIFKGPIRRGVPPSQEKVPDWRPDFFIPEYPYKRPEPPAPDSHETPAPARGNRIASPQDKSRSPSK